MEGGEGFVDERGEKKVRPERADREVDSGGDSQMEGENEGGGRAEREVGEIVDGREVDLGGLTVYLNPVYHII